MQRPQDDVVPLHEPFETTLRGFNREQVLAHIESLDGRISMIADDRESALVQVAELSRTIDHLREESELLAQLRQEAEKATKQAERMQQSPIFAANTRVQRILQLAEEEVADIKARAEQEIAARHERAASAAEALLRGTAQRCKLLEAESEQRRKAAEQDTERDIARRESEASARIQSRDQRSTANLHAIMQIIGLHLAERVSLVEQKEAKLADVHARTGQEVAALEALRTKITAQLSTTRHALAAALEQVEQAKIDHPGPVQPMPIQRDGRPGERVVAGGSTNVTAIRANERRHPSA